jgi:hypothetical protein
MGDLVFDEFVHVYVNTAAAATATLSRRAARRAARSPPDLEFVQHAPRPTDSHRPVDEVPNEEHDPQVEVARSDESHDESDVRPPDADADGEDDEEGEGALPKPFDECSDEESSDGRGKHHTWAVVVIGGILLSGAYCLKRARI